MARYIDMDLLKEMIEAKADTVINAKQQFHYIAGWLDHLPPADVVPKSEVDRLTVELEAMRGSANSYKMHYENAKQEIEELQGDLVVWKQNRFNIFQSIELYDKTRAKVAREIFEEIESEIKLALESNYKAKREHIDKSYYCLHAEFLSAVQGKIDALRGIDDFIAELKKKYTESEGKG